jgi:hypothetical protein
MLPGGISFVFGRLALDIWLTWPMPEKVDKSIPLLSVEGSDLAGSKAHVCDQVQLQAQSM